MKTKNLLSIIAFFVLTTTTTFAVNNLTIQEFSLSQEPELTIIESLDDGESYSIEITSIGCFNGTRQTVVISKENGKLKASFQNTIKTLTNLDIEAFKTFELHLRTLELGGCTTVDTYVLRYGNQIFSTSDGTCSWNGGKKLLQAIS